MLYKDQLDRSLEINSVPRRIVCLVPSLTELLVDLGLENTIVGLTKFCVHPAGFKKKKVIVGGTKQVDFDKIEKLQPDFILCNKEENTKEMVEKAAAIAPVWVSDIDCIATNNEMIHLLGAIFKKEKEAEKIVNGILKEAKQFEQFMVAKPSLSAVYLIWKNPYMAAGKGTFIDAMLQHNKYLNVIEKVRYPEVSINQIKQATHILLSSEPYPFKEKEVTQLKIALPSGTKVLLVDGEYFSWYGSRLLKAFSYFKTLHS